MSRGSRTSYAVLGFLTWRPMSGYDLKKAIEQSTSNFWSESYGQIYPVLQTLARLGWARRRKAPGRGARARSEYEITARGRTELRRWLNAPTAPMPVRNELLLKLFFGRQGNPIGLRRQIAAEREGAVAGMARMRDIRDLLTAHADQSDAPYWLATLRLGELQSQAYLQWCDEVLTSFDRLVPPTATRRPTRRPVRGDVSVPQPRRRRTSKS